MFVALSASLAGAGLLATSPAGAAEGKACSLVPGSAARRIEVEGETRHFSLSVGSRVSQAVPAPLVLIWHGWGGSPGGMLRAFDSERLWREAIFVAPQGLPRRFPSLGSAVYPGWQLESGEFGDRDLKLFDAIVAALGKEGCIDPKRVYSTGFSNGAFLSNLLGCERAEALAAIAPASGGGPGAATCGGRMPVLITHGMSDSVVPFAQGQKSFARWRTENGCAGSLAAPQASCVAAAGCAADVEFCSFEGRHRLLGDTVRRIVEFLRRHTRQ